MHHPQFKLNCFEVRLVEHHRRRESPLQCTQYTYGYMALAESSDIGTRSNCELCTQADAYVIFDIELRASPEMRAFAMADGPPASGRRRVPRLWIPFLPEASGRRVPSSVTYGT